MTKVSYDEIGYWSELKLDIIRDYATEYTKILSKQASINRFIYIDAFAGAGQHISKTSGKFIPGSPLNALNITPPFSEYHFIDLNRSRVQSLTGLAAERNDVTVYEGNCNDILVDQVFPRCKYDDFARGLCLLDPYRIDVDWKILETAGQMKSVEIFYNFMIMDANMNVLWRKNPDKVPEKQKARMTAVWGDESWRDAAYITEPSLFEDMVLEDKASNDVVAEAFRKRLQDVAGFNYVPKPIPMKNSSGATVYYLFFASPNEAGGRIVRHIFNKYRNYQYGS